MLLEKINTQDQILNRIQDNIKKILDPISTVPLNSGYVLSSVSLISGSNSINHKLGRTLQGWFTVRQRALASIYDTQDSNPSPEMTLLLTSNAPVVIDLFVF